MSSSKIVGATESYTKCRMVSLVTSMVFAALWVLLSPTLYASVSLPSTRQETHKDRGKRGIRKIPESIFFPFVSSLNVATNKLQPTSLKDQQPTAPP